MKNNAITNESYIKSNYKNGSLQESQGGSKALSEFLDLLVADDEVANVMKSEHVGAKIHKEISSLK